MTLHHDSEAFILGLLRRVGSLVENTHAVYRSWDHGDTYAHHEPMLADTMAMAHAGQVLAEACREIPFDATLSPAANTAVLAHFVAYHHTATSPGNARPRAYYAEQDDAEHMVLPPAYRKGVRDKRILIVTDVLINGTRTRALARLVREAGGTVAGVATLCSRKGAVVAEDAALPLASLAQLPFRAWPEGSCELCAAGTPIDEEIGRGREFVLRRASLAPG